jgi:hypothetical protein
MCVLERVSPFFYLDVPLIVALVILNIRARNVLVRLLSLVLVVLATLGALVLLYGSYYNCNVD